MKMFNYPVPTLLDGIVSTFDLSGKYFSLEPKNDMDSLYSDLQILQNDARIAFKETLKRYAR